MQAKFNKQKSQLRKDDDELDKLQALPEIFDSRRLVLNRAKPQAWDEKEPNPWESNPRDNYRGDFFSKQGKSVVTASGRSRLREVPPEHLRVQRLDTEDTPDTKAPSLNSPKAPRVRDKQQFFPSFPDLQDSSSHQERDDLDKLMYGKSTKG